LAVFASPLFFCFAPFCVIKVWPIWPFSRRSFEFLADFFMDLTVPHMNTLLSPLLPRVFFLPPSLVFRGIAPSCEFDQDFFFALSCDTFFPTLRVSDPTALSFFRSFFPYVSPPAVPTNLPVNCAVHFCLFPALCPLPLVLLHPSRRICPLLFFSLHFGLVAVVLVLFAFFSMTSSSRPESRPFQTGRALTLVSPWFRPPREFWAFLFLPAVLPMLRVLYIAPVRDAACARTSNHDVGRPFSVS